MAFKLIWSPTAKFDLRDMAAFIAEDSASAAERFVGSLFQAVERLGDFPESGRIAKDMGVRPTQLTDGLGVILAKTFVNKK
jgi:plasmid stabilization system protein ParE